MSTINKRLFIIAVLSVTVLNYLLQNCIQFQYTFFCEPAAHLAHLAIGGDLHIISDGEPQLLLGSLLIRVTQACSGVSFFLLLSAIAALSIFTSKHHKWHCALIVPGAYLLTLIVNSSRIICSYHINRMLPSSLSIPFEISHMALGMAIFLPALAGSYVLLKHLYHKEVING